MKDEPLVIPATRAGHALIEFWQGREQRLPDMSVEPMHYLDQYEQGKLGQLRREHEKAVKG